jgi:hypothetical protein
VLAMLAVLRVAPLLPSPTLRAVAKQLPGRDGKAGSLIELESCVWRRANLAAPVMHFYSGPPMHFLSALTAAPGEGLAPDSGAKNDLRCLCRETAVRRRGDGAANMTSISWHMAQRSDRTASSSMTLVGRRPQSLACGDPCGAPGLTPSSNQGPEQ